VLNIIVTVAQNWADISAISRGISTFALKSTNFPSAVN
jgi:hypothetical protein